MTESIVYLSESSSGEMVEATLCDEVTDEHLVMWDRDWIPEMRAFVASGAHSTPEDAHWDWKAKAQVWRTYLKYQSCALVCEGTLQGLMLLNNIKSARLQEHFGKPLMYLEFVATAPWNRPEMKIPPMFRGVGRTFVLAAIHFSMDAGFKGRIGLHSLSKAEEFYENKCGMTRLGPDSAYQDLTYFEMTETQANSFRRNHRKP
jgi:hypothetical protein